MPLSFKFDSLNCVDVVSVPALHQQDYWSHVSHLPKRDPEVLREESVEHRVDAAVHVRQHMRHDLRRHREVGDVVRVQRLHQQDYLERKTRV